MRRFGKDNSILPEYGFCWDLVDGAPYRHFCESIQIEKMYLSNNLGIPSTELVDTSRWETFFTTKTNYSQVRFMVKQMVPQFFQSKIQQGTRHSLEIKSAKQI